MADHSSIRTSLLERAKARDAAAWEDIVDAFHGIVYKWCRRAGLTAPQAKDVGQEVFLSVFQSLPNGFVREKATESFIGFLRRITDCRVADFKRKFHKDLAVGNIAVGGTSHHIRVNATFDKCESDHDSPIVQSDPPTERAEVVRRITFLVKERTSERTWRIFEDFVIYEMDGPTVAQKYATTPDNVYVIAFRVKKKIRECIENDFGDLLD